MKPGQRKGAGQLQTWILSFPRSVAPDSPCPSLENHFVAIAISRRNPGSWIPSWQPNWGKIARGLEVRWSLYASSAKFFPPLHSNLQFLLKNVWGLILLSCCCPVCGIASFLDPSGESRFWHSIKTPPCVLAHFKVYPKREDEGGSWSLYTLHKYWGYIYKSKIIFFKVLSQFLKLSVAVHSLGGVPMFGSPIS